MHLHRSLLILLIVCDAAVAQADGASERSSKPAVEQDGCAPPPARRPVSRAGRIADAPPQVLGPTVPLTSVPWAEVFEVKCACVSLRSVA